jgi:hypothetical protein
MANYTFRSSFSYRTLHLEGEEVFGFAKKPANYPPSAENDSHHHDRVNFFHPQVIVIVTPPNVVRNVGMQQPPYGSNACSPLIF